MLLNKDILEAKKYLQKDFKFALAKGRYRYLCIRNLINLIENKTSDTFLFNDELSNKLNTLLQNYSSQKWDGEIDSLENKLDDNLWKKIACNRLNCTAKECEFYNDCVFFIKKPKTNFLTKVSATQE